MLLDWDRYAIAGSPGHFLKEGKTARVTIEALCPTYLSQSTKHFCKRRPHHALGPPHFTLTS